jgi:hypothetical protein
MEHITDKEARLLFELTLGKEVSNSYWWKVKSAFRKFSVDFSRENITCIAKAKRITIRPKVSPYTLIAAYLRAVEAVNKTHCYTGKEVKRHLKNLGITPHQTTLNRWFNASVGAFSQYREYPSIDLISVFLSAFLYKLKQQRQATVSIPKKTSIP